MHMCAWVTHDVWRYLSFAASNAALERNWRGSNEKRTCVHGYGWRVGGWILSGEGQI